MLKHLEQALKEINRRAMTKPALPFKVPFQTMSPVPYGEPKVRPNQWWYPNINEYLSVSPMITADTPIGEWAKNFYPGQVWKTDNQTTYTCHTSFPYHLQTK